MHLKSLLEQEGKQKLAKKAVVGSRHSRFGTTTILQSVSGSTHCTIITKP